MAQKIFPIDNEAAYNMLGNMHATRAFEFIVLLV